MPYNLEYKKLLLSMNTYINLYTNNNPSHSYVNIEVVFAKLI